MSEGPRAPEPTADRADDSTRGEARSSVRVRLVRNGRELDCECGSLVLRQGEQVLVDDRRTSALGRVTIPSGTRPVQSLQGRVIRKAEARDVARAEQEQKRQDEALAFARERARALGLPIKLFRADIGPGSDRATFLFSCEQRVDFRALVRDLAGHLHARIEMRQVGVRDESKLTGGIGSCGRELCCSTFLVDFEPVSVRMAKDQDLPLNPLRISGACGRLMCCLKYEHPLYQDFAETAPGLGETVETPDGEGVVVGHNVPGEHVVVRMSGDGRRSVCALASVCSSRKSYESRSDVVADD